MNYYINTKNQVFAFDIATQSSFVEPDMVLISKSYTGDQYQFLKLNNGVVEFDDAAYASLKNDNSISAYQTAAQLNLDSVAKSWGYDSIISATSYANSTIPKFNAEALALIGWRDSVWSSAYALLANVLAGKKSDPKTVDEFLALLPAAPSRPA